MKKGVSDSIVILLGAITLLFFTAYVTWFFVYGIEHPRPIVSNLEEEDQKEVKEECLRDDDCEFDIRGSKCLDIVDPNYPERFIRFCGCYANEHCESTSEITRSGVCGQDNKCS